MTHSPRVGRSKQGRRRLHWSCCSSPPCPPPRRRRPIFFSLPSPFEDFSSCFGSLEPFEVNGVKFRYAQERGVTAGKSAAQSRPSPSRLRLWLRSRPPVCARPSRSGSSTRVQDTRPTIPDVLQGHQRRRTRTQTSLPRRTLGSCSRSRSLVALSYPAPGEL